MWTNKYIFIYSNLFAFKPFQFTYMKKQVSSIRRHKNSSHAFHFPKHPAISFYLWLHVCRHPGVHGPRDVRGALWRGGGRVRLRPLHAGDGNVRQDGRRTVESSALYPPFFLYAWRKVWTKIRRADAWKYVSLLSLKDLILCLFIASRGLQFFSQWEQLCTSRDMEPK